MEGALEDFDKRDELLAMVYAGLTKSVDGSTYPGGAGKLLSDLLYACNYPMEPYRIRDITSKQRHRQNPRLVSFSKALK